jgi:hypothetical protein
VQVDDTKLYVHVTKNRLDKIAAANASGYNLRDMQQQASLKPGDYSDDDNYRNYLSFYRNAGLDSGYNVEIKIGAVGKASYPVGWALLMSNFLRKGDAALYTYEKWGLISKTFDNVNDYDDIYEYPFSILQSRHDDVEKLHQGKIFCSFLSLILLSYIDNIMHSKSVYGSMTMQNMFKDLAKIKKMRIKNETILTDLSDNQKNIFKSFSIDLP